LSAYKWVLNFIFSVHFSLSNYSSGGGESSHRSSLNDSGVFNDDLLGSEGDKLRVQVGGGDGKREREREKEREKSEREEREKKRIEREREERENKREERERERGEIEERERTDREI
jgi:hypothetical protein